MPVNLKGRSFLTLKDFTPDEIRYMLNLAADLKAKKRAGIRGNLLAGKNIVLLFEKTSTRTRCAFEVAAYDEGAHVTFLDSKSSQMGKKETMVDTAKVLGRFFDGIEYRGYDQKVVEGLAASSCTACPPSTTSTPPWPPLRKNWATISARSPTRCSSPRTPRCSTRPRTVCTPSRLSWSPPSATSDRNNSLKGDDLFFTHGKASGANRRLCRIPLLYKKETALPTAERFFVQSSGMATARTGEPSAFLKRRGSVA